MRRFFGIFGYRKKKGQVPEPQQPMPAKKPASQQQMPASRPPISSQLPSIRPARPGSLDKLAQLSKKKAPPKPKEIMPKQEEDVAKRNPEREIPAVAKELDEDLIEAYGKKTMKQRASLKAFEERHEKLKKQVAAIAPIGSNHPDFLKAAEAYFKKMHLAGDPKQIFESMARETFQPNSVEPWKGAYGLVVRINAQQVKAGVKPEQIRAAVANALAQFFAELIRTGRWPTH